MAHFSFFANYSLEVAVESTVSTVAVESTATSMFPSSNLVLSALQQASLVSSEQHAFSSAVLFALLPQEVITNPQMARANNNFFIVR